MLKIVTLEFENKNKETRRATFLCNDTKDAIEFVKKIGGGKINNIGVGSTVHGYTDFAISYLIKKIGIDKPKDQKEETVVQSDNTKTIDNENQKTETIIKHICPWCEKEFEKPNGLKMHIIRMHQKNETDSETE